MYKLHSVMSVTTLFVPTCTVLSHKLHSLTYQTNLLYPKLHSIMYQITQSYVTDYTALCSKLHGLSTKLQSSVLRYAVLCNKIHSPLSQTTQT